MTDPIRRFRYWRRRRICAAVPYLSFLAFGFEVRGDDVLATLPWTNSSATTPPASRRHQRIARGHGHHEGRVCPGREAAAVDVTVDFEVCPGRQLRTKHHHQAGTAHRQRPHHVLAGRPDQAIATARHNFSSAARRSGLLNRHDPPRIPTQRTVCRRIAQAAHKPHTTLLCRTPCAPP